ncbi:HprK-related kinase A [Candidatus Colwellia aromaticivorans]|uniref:HprK-related kinase A n=1 Tax=Candidatus Colwellia aromaticivorans TaxID=2267621 RepID=UPI000DF318C9|nr:HprK-related kinase A [Candidatus Colwellia aromaticivorans]
MPIKKTLRSLSTNEIIQQLKNDGLVLAVGPFVFCIKSSLSSIASNVQKIYGDFQLLSHDDLIDFYVAIKKPRGLRSFIKPQINFYCNDSSPFLPLPASQAFPLLEWGMNWCIAQHAHHYLLLHSAVLEKNGKSVILPAQSGSGKSTLCALLALNGWRLLSDEMALIDLKSNQLHALARPISLKNESINVILNQPCATILGEVVDDTTKGTISHLKPSTASVQQVAKTVAPFAIVFPKYQANQPINTKTTEKATAFMAVIENSFNYAILAEAGFNAVAQLIDNTQCHTLAYSSTEEVLAFFEELAS